MENADDHALHDRELKAALAVVVKQLLGHGNNYAEVTLFADGGVYKMRMQIKEIIEGQEEGGFKIAPGDKV